MCGDGSLGYWSHETIHSSSHCCKDDIISDDESLEVPVGDGRRGHRYLETSHSSTCNRRYYHISDVGRSGSRSQETIDPSSPNYGTRVYVEVRGG